MPELSRWSGNDTTMFSIFEKEYDDLIMFASKCETLYLFGNGKIGSALYRYLSDSGFQQIKVIVSKDFDELKEKKIKDKSGVIIGVSNQYFREIMPGIKELFEDEQIYIPSEKLREEIGEILNRNSLEDNFWINIYVTNKCNLSCKSCSAFAPICKEDFYELDKFKNDIRRIKDMNFEHIDVFKFTGAEAMLHPDIIEMLKYTRNLFPKIELQVYSNGLFIEKCPEEVLLGLARENTHLIITEYPIPKIDLSKAYKRLDKYGISYHVIFSEGQKYFSKRPLNFEKDTPRHKYIGCPRYRMCKSLFLFRGRLYKCIYALSAEYINEAFNKEFRVEKKDFIDIYDATTEDVYEYALHRIPYCGYCSPIEELVPWAFSNRTIDEWT